MGKPYTKKYSIEVWSRYYGTTKREAKEALDRAIENGTDIYERIRLMEDYFHDQSRKAAYED